MKVRKSPIKISTTLRNLIKIRALLQHFTRITFPVPLPDKTIKNKIKIPLATIEKELRKNSTKLS
jgi:hypothetical protein